MTDQESAAAGASAAQRHIAELEARIRRSGLPGFDDAAEYLNAVVWSGDYDHARLQAGQWHRAERKNPYLAYHYARFLAHEDEVAGLKWYADLARECRADPNWQVVLARLQTDVGQTLAGLETVRELLVRTSGWPHLLSTYAFNSLYLPELDPVENLKILRQLVPRHLGAPATFSATVSKRPRYTIGFVCGNLRQHPISTFLLPLLAGLDRKLFMVVVFSSNRKADAVTLELQKGCDLWYDTAGMSDDELLALIRSDRLDVLVDLDNHSHPNRLGVFARRAAPIQMSWYGLNMSTALETMDYRLTDAIVDPPGSESQYTERLLRTRNCHVSYMGTTFPATAAPMLANGRPTFGSFNDWKKVDAAQVDRWAELLRTLPGSGLKLVGFSDALAGLRVRRQLGQAGIDPGRVTLEGRVPPRELYRHIQSVDLAIDSWPFGGGATTATTLSLGVPVVTALGSRAHSRVSASMLRDLEMDRYATTAPDRLAAHAAGLCADAGALNADRAAIAARFADTIGDGRRLAAEVGELLIRAIERCAKGKPADHDAL